MLLAEAFALPEITVSTFLRIPGNLGPGRAGPVWEFFGIFEKRFPGPILKIFRAGEISEIFSIFGNLENS